MVRSPHDRRQSPHQKLHLWKLHDRSSIARQSKLDCHVIVARSPRDRGPIAGRSCSRSRPIKRQNWGGFIARLKPRRRPKERLPRPLQIAPTTAPINHDFWAKFLFKNQCISLLFFNFDRFVKELNKFQRRSLVHRDPPAFRLNCDAIRAGLIANFSLISSNFPLEFRTSTRKNLSKFASIHEELKPHSLGNQVSSEIRSIIKR